MSLLGKLNPARLPKKMKEKVEQAAIQTVLLGWKAGGESHTRAEYNKIFKAINKTLNDEIDEKVIKIWADLKKQFLKPFDKVGPILEQIQEWLPEFCSKLEYKIVSKQDKIFIRNILLPYVKTCEEEQLSIILRQMKLMR